MGKSNNAVAIAELKELTDVIKTSDLAKPFRITDKDGNYKLDKDGNPEVDTGAIMSNMILGNELGITPMASLLLGKALNAKSYFSVLKGRTLGLDPVTSIDKIYNIPTKNGDKLSLDVSVISRAIILSGTKMEYIRDAQIVPTYKTVVDNKYAGHKFNICNADGSVKDGFYISPLNVTDLAKPENKEVLTEVQKQNRDGKTVVYKSGSTKVTSLRLVRKLDNGEIIDNTFHYSLQEAIDAELVSGVHSSRIDPQTGKLEVIEVKSAWTYHENTMLRNRVTSIAGRIMVADLLAGTYSHEEMVEIVNAEEEAEYEDITELKNDKLKEM